MNLKLYISLDWLQGISGKKWIAKRICLFDRNVSVSKDEGPRFLVSLLDQPFYSILEGCEVTLVLCQSQVFSDNAGFKVSGCGETSVFRLEHQLCPKTSDTTSTQHVFTQWLTAGSS